MAAAEMSYIVLKLLNCRDQTYCGHSKFRIKVHSHEILSYTFLDRAGAEFVQTTNANLSEDQALALALAQSEFEAKKREEESRNRVVDAAAS